MGLGLRTAVTRCREALAFSPLVTAPRRITMLRDAGWTGLGECWIEADCAFQGTLESRARLVVADGAYINMRTIIATRGGVFIGRNAYIGHGCRVLSVSHEMGGHDQRAGAGTSAPVSIGAGAWLGAGVTVLPGVTIGDGAVIGAGAVVTRDCEPDTLYVGVPARAVRRLDQA